MRHPCSREPSLAQRLSLPLKVLRPQVEARGAWPPEYVVQMDHATGRRPFEHSNIRAGPEDRDHYCFERELQAYGAVPRYEEGYLFTSSVLLLLLNTL